jgi:hypothetical protein
MKVFMTNLGKYNEGRLVGAWLTLPCSEAELAATLKAVGIGGEYEEYFITDYESDLGLRIGEYACVHQLNEVTERIARLDSYELKTLQAIIELEAPCVSTLSEILGRLDYDDVDDEYEQEAVEEEEYDEGEYIEEQAEAQYAPDEYEQELDEEYEEYEQEVQDEYEQVQEETVQQEHDPDDVNPYGYDFSESDPNEFDSDEFDSPEESIEEIQEELPEESPSPLLEKIAQFGELENVENVEDLGQQEVLISNEHSTIIVPREDLGPVGGIIEELSKDLGEINTAPYSDNDDDEDEDVQIISEEYVEEDENIFPQEEELPEFKNDFVDIEEESDSSAITFDEVEFAKPSELGFDSVAAPVPMPAPMPIPVPAVPPTVPPTVLPIVPPIAPPIVPPVIEPVAAPIPMPIPEPIPAPMPIPEPMAIVPPVVEPVPVIKQPEPYIPPAPIVIDDFADLVISAPVGDVEPTPPAAPLVVPPAPPVMPTPPVVPPAPPVMPTPPVVPPAPPVMPTPPVVPPAPPVMPAPVFEPVPELIIEPAPVFEPVAPVAPIAPVAPKPVESKTEDDFSGFGMTPQDVGIYSHRSPARFVMFGRKVDVKDWAEMLVKVCEILILKNPYTVAQFDKYHDLNPLGNCYFSYNQGDIKGNGKKLSNGLWVEINRSADDIVMLCKKVLELCGYPRSELEIEFND